MSSGGSSNLGAKSLPTPASYNASAQQISAPQASFESGSRRSGLSSPSLPSSASPRKGQASRKQHRSQRRPDRNPDDDDAMAEIRAVRNASSRRGQTSITHLLNYSVPSRHYQDHHHRGSRRHPTWAAGSGSHAVDKTRFVHANYRFVVSPTGNYGSQAVDADKHLDWSDVLQIIASSKSQTTSCPICFCDPVAPRMARCGHIFCLPCLMRFMNSTNDDEPSPRKEARWKKCPICEDTFRLAEVRPVRFYEGQENPLPNIGSDVVLRLMVREAGSTLALPDEGGSDIANLGEDVPWHFAASVLDYARIMKGTNDYVIEQFEREMEDLRIQAHEDEIQYGVEEGDWPQRAIRAINTAKEKLKEQQAMGAGPAPATLKSKHPAKQKFHFYTAPPHLYLSPLDIRILKTKFGDFSDFPSTLLPRVEHISAGHVVDDALRKRAKYLAHLPQGCVVSFLECDWTDIVPSEILETFSNDLERRRKLHRDKAAQEERERLQAERLEAAAIGRSARRHFDNINGDGIEHTPIVNSEDFQPLGPPTGTSPPTHRPGFEQLADMSTSPTTSRTVWGTPAIPVSPDLRPVPEPRANDGWLNEDDFLGAAEIAMQMEAFGIGSTGSTSTPSPAPGAASGKKKKKQKITLMSTGGHRGT
ncbi:putative RING-15 protein [Rosellinia necatrix]|uniref:Putative RING-15 protein n=1 Tax=Rosellinia necatrix TaxID=77044 RepID=A0A1S8A7G7_ROSNE|nr:putative RING-15 protein [Rosellinia necatrix]